MEEDLNLDLDKIEQEAEEQLKVKNRYKQLSEKVILTEKEKGELSKAKEELEKSNATLAKERDFFKDFSTHSSKYPNATEYQDKIWEKVKVGYDVEDAIVSTLSKEGKLPTPVTPKVDVNVEGGSAPNQIGDLGDKTVSEMTTEEKLTALGEAEKRGDISI